jgi:hypothetical protein
MDRWYWKVAVYTREGIHTQASQCRRLYTAAADATLIIPGSSDAFRSANTVDGDAGLSDGGRSPCNNHNTHNVSKG